MAGEEITSTRKPANPEEVITSQYHKPKEQNMEAHPPCCQKEAIISAIEAQASYRLLRIEEHHQTLYGGGGQVGLVRDNENFRGRIETIEKTLEGQKVFQNQVRIGLIVGILLALFNLFAKFKF